MLYLILIALPLISCAPGSYSYHSQRIGRHRGFEYELNNGRYQYSPSFHRYYNTYQTYKNPDSGTGLTRTFSSSDLVKETKSLANNVIPTLKSLAANPRTAGTVDKIIKDNYSPCLNSIEEGISSLRTASDLVESIEPDVKALLDKFNSFTTLKDPVKILRETGSLMRLLAPLAEKTGFTGGRSDTGCDVGSLRSLALLTSELAEKPNIYRRVREDLRKSSAYISTVTTYLTKLKATTARLSNFCTDDNKYKRDSITAIGDLMEDLADLYGSLGDAKTGEKIRYGKVYIDQVTAQISKLDSVGLDSPDCTNHGDISASAQVLDDLAKLIEDVGLENLKEQLGVDLNLNFDFDPSAAAVKSFKY